MKQWFALPACVLGMAVGIGLRAERPQAGQGPGAAVAPPPNAAAELRVQGDVIQLRYNGTLVFDGRVKNRAAVRAVTPSVSGADGRVDQVVALYAQGREPVEITGTVTASAEAFAARVRPPAARAAQSSATARDPAAAC